MDKYMAAVTDMTRDTGNGRFENVFCRLLWAQKGMIEELQTKVITLMKGGSIKSADWTDANGDKGFLIDGDSDNAWFNNGKFKGRIEANEGYFEGELDCDSLQVKSEPTSMRRFPESGYWSNPSPTAVKNSVASFLGTTRTEFTVSVDDGGYTSLLSETEYKLKKLLFHNDGRITIYYALPSGALEHSTTSTLLPVILGRIWFQLGTSLKKIRLVDLPNSAGGPSGTVYKAQSEDGNFYVKVKA